ncbi:MAG: hypothetical protein WC178_03640 [Candidatus Paceibacterota bacterium]
MQVEPEKMNFDELFKTYQIAWKEFSKSPFIAKTGPLKFPLCAFSGAYVPIFERIEEKLPEEIKNTTEVKKLYNLYILAFRLYQSKLCEEIIKKIVLIMKDQIEVKLPADERDELYNIVLHLSIAYHLTNEMVPAIIGLRKQGARCFKQK